MSFAGQGVQFDQFVNEHVHSLSQELVSIGTDIDMMIEEGEFPAQEAIEAMFYAIDKMKAQGKYFKQIADGIAEMLKNVLDEGSGALAKEEEPLEEEDEVGEELRDIAKHARDVITILDANGIDEEIIMNIVQFAEYIEMLL